MVREPFEVPVQSLSLEPFAPLVGEEELARIRNGAAGIRERFTGRAIWNVNSTAAGGGVAEMLGPLVGYALGLKIPVRWVVLQGDGRFFEITKRLHNGLHGTIGDGGLLGKEEIQHYREVSEQNLLWFRENVQPRDVVILHDPQTAGLTEGLRKHGATVVWRCHVGHDRPNHLVERSWSFLQPFLEPAQAMCFSRRSYAPPWADDHRVHVIPPSIDPFSAKNQEMSSETVRAVLGHLGIIQISPDDKAPLTFRRGDGSEGRIKRHADILHAGPLPSADTPLIVQVSRWDQLKDMVGVMRGFADHVLNGLDAHLALVGPNVHGVSDDPEGAKVYQHCVDVWRDLRHFQRNRVQLVTLPMRDVEENHAMVNAIQRHATIVVQKSLYEGFGLTVSEAMWKKKPVVASAVGGILDQIEDGRTGTLLQDPTSLADLGEELCSLLANPERREKMGTAAREHVRKHFLATRHLIQYADLLSTLDGEGA